MLLYTSYCQKKAISSEEQNMKFDIGRENNMMRVTYLCNIVK